MIRERWYAIRCNREGVNFHRTVIRETLARIRSFRVSIHSMHDVIRERFGVIREHWHAIRVR
jgi:hypothetical protein